MKKRKCKGSSRWDVSRDEMEFFEGWDGIFWGMERNSLRDDSLRDDMVYFEGWPCHELWGMVSWDGLMGWQKSHGMVSRDGEIFMGCFHGMVSNILRDDFRCFEGWRFSKTPEKTLSLFGKKFEFLQRYYCFPRAVNLALWGYDLGCKKPCFFSKIKTKKERWSSHRREQLRSTTPLNQVIQCTREVPDTRARPQQQKRYETPIFFPKSTGIRFRNRFEKKASKVCYRRVICL